MSGETAQAVELALSKIAELVDALTNISATDISISWVRNGYRVDIAVGDE